MVHVLGLALTVNQDCLHSLLVHPIQLGKYFIPTMPNDERLALMEVLGTVFIDSLKISLFHFIPFHSIFFSCFYEVDWLVD
jgi:hypothetical protein